MCSVFSGVCSLCVMLFEVWVNVWMWVWLVCFCDRLVSGFKVIVMVSSGRYSNMCLVGMGRCGLSS